MAKNVRWEEMFPDDLRAAIQSCPACLLAYGLAEPHGPYNAIGLDFLKAKALVEMSAERNGGVVAPPLAWHVQEQPHFPWLHSSGVGEPLCSSIPADLFYRIVIHQIRAVDARGFHAAILVTGHYGGLERDMSLLGDFYRRKTGSPLQVRVFADWELMTYGNYRGDHAGIIETSQLMFLRPELVDLKRTVDSSPLGRFCGTSFPTKAGEMPSRELGEKIVLAQIERLGQVQQEMLGQYQPRDGWQAPSPNDVESLWTRFERATRKYWVCSLTLDEYRQRKYAEFPGWEALGE